MNRLEALRAIADEVESGPLEFAGHVEVGLKIRDALADPDCHLDQASQLLQMEPGLASQVVAIANSAAYNTSGREVTDVKTAAARLGFSTLRSLAAAHIVKHMADSPANPDIARMRNELWQHTIQVAALCRTIARRITRLDPETALFVGLVHEVGSFYLLSRAEKYPALLDVEPAEHEADPVPDDEDEEPTAELEGELTLSVLRQLNVPGLVLTPVADFCEGFMELPPVSMGDTLLMADFLAPTSSPLRTSRSLDDSTRATVNAQIGESTLTEILSESAEEVQSLTRALAA